MVSQQLIEQGDVLSGGAILPERGKAVDGLGSKWAHGLIIAAVGPQHDPA
jgi:hypothetical protein